MDANTIMTLISSLGFPIVVAIACFWYIKYSQDNNNQRFDNMQKDFNETISKMQTEHREEISKVTEALQNNTLALQKLCDKLDA